MTIEEMIAYSMSLAGLKQCIIDSQEEGDAFTAAMFTVLEKSMEKQMPKSPLVGDTDSFCPVCGRKLNEHNRAVEYCNCGQKLIVEGI